MTVSLTTTPADALPGLPCRVLVTATAGNHVRLWCTDAPAGSALKKKLEQSGASREGFQSGIDAGKDFEFIPDKGGVYRLQAEEMQLGAAAYGGGYKGDPNADQSETILGTTSLSLSVATELTSQLGADHDTATLRLYVKGANIIATRQDVHGVTSPVIAAPTSPKALTASNAATVQTALAALAGAAVSAVLGSLTNVFDDLRTQYLAHATSGSIHYSADTVNDVSDALVGPVTEARLVEAFAVLRDALDFHMRDDDRTAVPPGTGTGDFHSSSDGRTQLLVQQPRTIADCVPSAADLHRAFEAHRQYNGIHDNDDMVNVAAALPPLCALHSAFLAVLASPAPTTPDNEHSGVTLLVNGAGFQRA